MDKLPASARISFGGAVDRQGMPLVPHSMAFPSAMMSLGVLMGIAHDTPLLQKHGRAWRTDQDYYRYLGISGEGFRVLSDTAEYFRCTLPEGAGPLRDCFQMAGIPVCVLSNAKVQGVDGGWPSEEALRTLVMRNLAEGFPVLLLGRTKCERVLLAIGYEDGGQTLVAWTFTPGADMTNKSFAPEDCQFIEHWTQGVDAAALVRGLPEQPGSAARQAILRRALARGEGFLRTARSEPYGKPVHAYENWIAHLRDEAFWAGAWTGFPFIYPEIWDLAERRFYLAAVLRHAEMALGTDSLEQGAAAAEAIHEIMWRIHALCEGERGRDALRDASVRAQIGALIAECAALDITIADAVQNCLNPK